jgi:hypothetical protein
VLHFILLRHGPANPSEKFPGSTAESIRSHFDLLAGKSPAPRWCAAEPPR